MKKIIYPLTGVLLAATLMMGCGSKTTTTDAQNTKNTESTSTNDTSAKRKAIQKPDLEGEVTNISENKITLKVVKIPEVPSGEFQGKAQTENSAKDANKDADKSKSDNSREGQDSKTPKSMKVEYTGETKNITIANGVQIKTMGKKQQDSESKNLTVNDIKVGDILQITYSDKENQTISTINVRSSSSQK